MQDLFESELDGAEGLDDAEGFEDELDEADLGEDPLEDALADEAEDGFEDDAFEDEAFEGDGMDEDALEAEAFEDDAFEDDGFEASDGADDEFDELDESDEFEEADEGDELDDAFAYAMDAADDDEFARRLSSRLTRLRRIARPYLRQMARRAVPIGLRLIRYVARYREGSAPMGLDAMDAFADAAADEAMAGRSANAYIPFLAGLAGRYVTRAILRAARRDMGPGAARALGRAVTRATRKAARKLVAKRGPKALRSVPRIVRKVANVARKRAGSARAIPRMIKRAATRVASSPRATARLSRPNAAVRRVRVRAGTTGVTSAATSAGRLRRRRSTELRRAI